MKRLIIILLFLSLISTSVFAGDPIELAEILTAVQAIQDINGDIKDINSQIKDFDEQIKNFMEGNYSWGSYFVTDYHTWKGNETWSDVISMAQHGSYSGDLGDMMETLARDFPININIVNISNSNEQDQKDYALKASIALAARTASQYDYDQIQKQIDEMNKIKTEIDKTENLKSAVDLQNRLQVENSMMQLSILRQLSLLNQQQALKSQEEANAMVKNAEFLGAQ